MKTIYLAGGCFWGLEKFFAQFGLKTQTGYANGCEGPVSYQQVCAGSGHAEAVRIDYEEGQLPEILAAFFAAIDPTSVNRQGNDVGINYRTGIYCTDKEQLEIARAMLKDLQAHFDKPIAEEAEMLKNYVPAEEYHQNYLEKNPGGYCHLPRQLMTGHILPSRQKVLEVYPSLKTILNQ